MISLRIILFLKIVLFFAASLHHPISLDVFESSLYWVARDNGELLKQDKFGRGVAVVIAKDIESPSGVKGK